MSKKHSSKITGQSPLPGILPEVSAPNPAVLRPDIAAKSYDSQGNEVIEALPNLILPTRWEYLQPKITGEEELLVRTIIRPVYSALDVLRDIFETLTITGGAQLLIMRADTGSGKTTFLNTVHHYIQDIKLNITTIDLQPLSEKTFADELWKFSPRQDGINLLVLEGREKPADVSDDFMQVVLANINRFSRTKRVPLLFVIPTIEEEVARSWCEHGASIGDLIPEQVLYEGSKWYRFPGVARDQYVEIAEETVRVLNAPYTLIEYGVSPDEVKTWSQSANTIGDYIATLANKIANRRRKARIPTRGTRERVWVVFCSPDNRHYDHTYHIIQGLVLDDSLRASSVKLVPPSSDAQLFKHWRTGIRWAQLLNAVNYLDLRLVNLPITTVVSAALAYGDDDLLQSFKDTSLEDYRSRIPDDMKTEEIDWTRRLSSRRLQAMNARDSMEGSNLARLLRGMPAEQLKGGNAESVLTLAQYLHLREKANEKQLHYYLGMTLRDLLAYQRVPGYRDVGTETPLVSGQVSPQPDITVYFDSDVYALELHFLRKQIVASEIQTYTLKNVLEKYMRDLPHLQSQLQTLE